MKQACRNLSMLLLAAAFISPVIAQEDKGVKGDKGVKEEKVVKDKKNVEEIVIVRKGNNSDKVVVEINGDKVTVNGKPIEDLKDGDVSVRRHKIKDAWAYADGLQAYGGNFDKIDFNGMANNYKAFSIDSNRAMLGVTTEKAEGGVSIESVTKESAASKAGLKEGDVITKVNDKAIVTPDDLSSVIKKHKPGEKVTVTYLRDKAENKATAELGKWKGSAVFSTGPGNFQFNMDEMNLGTVMPRTHATPRINGTYTRSNTPKLGLSVQDSDDGKGVKVLNVDEESNAAKAGLKENDTIVEFDGKVVNSADEVAKLVRESKDKISVMVKVQRSGKSQNIELRMPRKLKTADL